MTQIPVAEYVRMSTEHQQYSTENQRDAIRLYAQRHGMVVTRSYVDAGKSGLTIERRDALKRLISDVQSHSADFSAILVYDLSRWGRFQDTDESAYYEYICRRSNIQVHYCAEPFNNDGSVTSTIVKTLKRAMAAEYSRELSAKVFAGQSRLIQLGYRQGGPAGVGLRRMLCATNGDHKGVLSRGERKSIHTDRVILVPGAQKEVELVRSIYRMFLDEHRSADEIIRILKENGVTTEFGHRWSRCLVHDVLTNEKYIGSNVYNRTSVKLQTKRVFNPPNTWIKKPGAFEPIISPDLFYRAQKIFADRAITNEELLNQLRDLLQREGRLSTSLVDRTEGMRPSTFYKSRFDRLVVAFQLAGYEPSKDYRWVQENRDLRPMRPKFISELINRIRQIGGSVMRHPAANLLTVNNEFTVSIIVARCRRWTRQCRSPIWLVPLKHSHNADITLTVRMDKENREPMDYYILPRIAIPFLPRIDERRRLKLYERNGSRLDIFRFGSLESFLQMIRPVKPGEAI
jgi:DNA invertase Pin-like site-specific DNA recombinase